MSSTAVKIQSARQGKWINDQTAKALIPQDGAICPQDQAAERAVVGTILAAGDMGKGNDQFQRVSHFLDVTDFYTSSIGLVYRAMTRVFEDKRQIDLASVRLELSSAQDRGKTLLDKVGGDDFLNGLVVSASANIESNAQIVMKAAMGRAALLESHRQAQIARKTMSMSLQELADELTTINADVETRLHAYTHQDSLTLADGVTGYLPRLMDEVRNPLYKAGISTGLANFDKVTLGLAKSKLYFLSAPPGWGKTALMMNMALHAHLYEKARVLYISTEMKIDEMVERSLVIESQVNYTNLRSRKITSFEERRLTAACDRLNNRAANTDLTFVHMNRPSIPEIESKLRQFQRGGGYDAVFLDYMGIGKIRFPANMENSENAQANAMYSAAEDWKVTFDIPLVCGIQMNRNYEKRKGRRPVMTDLYYGTRAEQAADFIGFIYHPSKVNKYFDSDPAELVVRKNRCGPGGDRMQLLMDWEPEYLTFRSDDENATGELGDDEE